MLIAIIFSFLYLANANGRLDEDLHKEDHIPIREHMIPTTNTPLPPIQSATCFHSSRTLCPKQGERCTRLLSQALLCCDVDTSHVEDVIVKELINNQDIQALHVINATLSELNVSQSAWRRLTSISFTDGNIKEVIGEFKKHSTAACFNISNNGIVNITSRALVQLFNLTSLDISGNRLTGMPHFMAHQKDLSVNIQGNNDMVCKSVLDALKQYGNHLKFLNTNTSLCTSASTFEWLNKSELVPIRQIEFIHKLKYACGEFESGVANCVCDPVRLDIVGGQVPTFSIKVDCSNRQLKKLPSKLPENTIMLNVSYNEISSLAPLSDHPSYDHVRQLYADHNNIQSIFELEGTKFLDNFIHLSLKANKLKSLPTYILSDTFDRNWTPRQVYLGNNQLHCDCNTAKTLKLWLLSKTNNVPDYDKLLCENIPGRVIDLAENKVCQQQKDWTDYINYIITIEILLLLALITKVSYDYWVFKNAGYLPWPASKMPKLPCDWLCE